MASAILRAASAAGIRRPRDQGGRSPVTSASQNSDSVGPRLTCSTPIPPPASSARSVPASDRRAALAAAYSPCNGRGWRPRIEPTNTITGSSPRVRSGRLRRTSSAGAVRSRSMIRAKVSGVRLRKGPIAPPPAAAMRASSPPSRDTAAATRRSRKAGSQMSPASGSMAAGAALRQSSSSLSPRRAVASTRAPREASSSATARPTPDDAPVTITRLPASRRRR